MYDLVDFRSTKYSQFGEDGILEKIFQVIGIDNQWCVEFGAWDGVHLSNTYSLVEKNWNAVLIEGDRRKFSSLRKRMKQHNGVIAVNRRIGIDSNTLDYTLSQTPIPEDFDLLSIDVDGDDYHLWRSLKDYKPRVVVIECNLTFPFNVEFVQKQGGHIGSSALSMYYLGEMKGYTMVCYNVTNCMFVRNDLARQLVLRNRNFVYLFHLGLEHHLHVSSSYNGLLYIMGDAVYGHHRTRKEKDLSKIAERYHVVRGEAYRALIT